MFKSALKIKYALFHEDYNFFKFIFDMQEANFSALATFHADWLALHNPFCGISSDLLHIVESTHSLEYFCSCIRRRRHFDITNNLVPHASLKYTVRDLAFYPP